MIVPSRTHFLALAVALLALPWAAAAPQEDDIDPSDLEIGQVGKMDTAGGRITYYSLAENPIGDGEVIIEPRTKDGVLTAWTTVAAYRLKAGP